MKKGGGENILFVLPDYCQELSYDKTVIIDTSYKIYL